MELRLQNSQTSTRKNYEPNDPIIIPADTTMTSTHVQDHDYFYINFVDHGTLAYTGPIEHSLQVEPGLGVGDCWRSVFCGVWVGDGRFYILHYQSNLYVMADVGNVEQDSPVVGLTLSQKPNKHCQFQFTTPISPSPKPSQPLYDTPLQILNISTQKNLQITKQNRFPHLSPHQQTQLTLKLFRKHKVNFDDLWITNQPANFLQNGDLVLLLNMEKTHCLGLELRNQLVYKDCQMKPVVNRKMLDVENYGLVENPLSQVKNSNIIFSLWRVQQVGSFNQCNNSIIHNRDTITFRHSFTNIILLKTWQSQSNFSSTIFELGKDGQQNTNNQNCGFHIRNKTTYCFNSKKVNQSAVIQQPLYLQDCVELDHRYLCCLEKVSCDSVRFLRVFNYNLVTFTQVLLDFITNRPDPHSQKQTPDPIDEKYTNLSLSRKGNLNPLTKNPRQLQPIDWQQILNVDYDKFKQLIKAYNRIFRILIRNRHQQSIYSNSYIMKTCLLLLQTIGNSLKQMSEIKRRKQPILQPLILSIYEYFINVVNPKYCHFSASIFHCLKKMIKIDGESTILVLYYLARVWNYGNSVDLFIEVLMQVEKEYEELVLSCIFDILQHSSQWKDEQPKKIQQMFTNLGISINFTNEQGVTISSHEMGTLSVLDFYESDRKSLLYLKIAVFSEAFTNNSEDISTFNQERLTALIMEFQKDRFRGDGGSMCNQRVGEGGKIRSQLRFRDQQRKPIYRSALIQFINFYLLSVCQCSISTLKNRKFLLLNSQPTTYQKCQSQSSQNEDIIISIQSNLNQKQDQSSAIMLNLFNKTGIDIGSEGSRFGKDSVSMRGKIRPNTNVYSLVNYQEPSVSIIQISENLEKIIQCLQVWDSLKMRRPESSNHKIITIATREQPNASPLTPTQPHPKKPPQNINSSSSLNPSQSPSNPIHPSLNPSIKPPKSLPKPLQQKLKKQQRQHLCFMLEGFNAVVGIMDIILSTGFTTIKMLCAIEEFALEVLGFFSRVCRGDGGDCVLTGLDFAVKYQRTATQLILFYKQIQQNEGLNIHSILIKQKIQQLQLSLNELFNIILMLKKRLIAHPAIEVIDRPKLFNFDKCLTQYFAIYVALYKPKKLHNDAGQFRMIDNGRGEGKGQGQGDEGEDVGHFNMELIRKLLNFYNGNYYEDKEEIVLINLPDSKFKIYQSNSPKNMTKTLQKQKRNESGSSEISNSNDQNSESKKIDEEFTAKIPQMGSNKQFLNRYAVSFKNCQQIVENLQMLTMLREGIDKGDLVRNSEVSKITVQIKKLLDLINQKLRELTQRNSQIDVCIIRAYQVSEKLLESIFCSENFQQDFVMDIVIFLCQNPPYFSTFSKLTQNLTYSLPLMKIFLKSLQHHLSTILKQATVEYQVTQQLKQAVSIVIKMIENCKRELKQKQFIVVMGVICEVFPNRAVSEKIYHILLEMHCEERNGLGVVYGKKVNFKKIIFNNGFKEQTNLGKSNIDKMGMFNEEASKKLSACRIVDGFKTLQTFKDLVTQAQQQQDRLQQTDQSPLFHNLISSINSHISLIFRVCENSDEVNRHFTQNIIKYDSLLLIAFDPQIPIKYKIPMTIYFRNDQRIYEDQLAISDYLSWIGVVLKDYQQYFWQLKEYIIQNNYQYEQFHSHTTTKSLRQKNYPKISLMLDTLQKQQNIGSSIFSSFNTKISSREYYYWQLLFSRPFMHHEEGVLVLLEEIMINMKELPIKSQGSFKDSVGRAVVEIYQALTGMYRVLVDRRGGLKDKEVKDGEAEDNCILDNLIRKIRKNLKLILQKYPSLRAISTKQIHTTETIAFNIVNTLIKNNLLKKFIKIFYYNEYKNINLPIIYDKKGQQSESDASDNSRLSFKHSRSSKMSHNSSSKDNCRVTEMAILKMSRKEVSIKEFQEQEEDGCRSNQALMVNGDRFLKKRSTLSPNTIRLNLNNIHYFEERAYMFYEVSKLLARVCELVQDPQLKSKLEEQFILFFQFRGTSKILKDQIVGVLRYLRLNYITQQKQRMGYEHTGFARKIKPLPSPLLSPTSSRPSPQIKQLPPLTLASLIKDLLLRDQLKIVTQLLKSIQNQKRTKSINTGKKMSPVCQQFCVGVGSAGSMGSVGGAVGNLEILGELWGILKIICGKVCVGFNCYRGYLVVLKYLLLVFLPQDKSQNGEVRRLQKKISNLLTQYLNKILLNVNKSTQLQTPKKPSLPLPLPLPLPYQRQQRHKKQTIISQITRMRENCTFHNYKLPQKIMEPLKRSNTNQIKEKDRDKVWYVPEMQIQFYRMIQLYGIVEARMGDLQREMYELVSRKLLRMVYGMTLGASLKLILKALLQKCQFSSTIQMPNIVTINQKLQYFLKTHITQMSDIKNLVSSNMNISQNLSFISIYYDYLYCLYWDYFLILSSNLKQAQTQHNQNNQNSQNRCRQENIQGFKISNDLWEAIVELEVNVFGVLFQEKRLEGGSTLFVLTKKMHQVESNRTDEDYERFRLLHKLLTQSINLFNIKAITQRLNEQWICKKKMGVQSQTKKQNFFVWTLNKFIQSRTSITQSKSSQSGSNESKIQVYTQLFSSLNHISLPIQQSNTQLLFSFLTETLCCQAIFKSPQFPHPKNIYFYKNYRSDWNQALISIIKSDQPLKSIPNEKDALKADRTDKENKIQYICQYLLAEADTISRLCRVKYNNDLISRLFVVVSLVLVFIVLVIQYCSLGVKLTEDQEEIVQRIQNTLLQVNFLLFSFLCLNKFTMQWRISKLKCSISQKTQTDPQQPHLNPPNSSPTSPPSSSSSIPIPTVLQTLLKNYSTTVFLTVLLLTFHIMTLYQHHFMPLLLFQLALYFQRIPLVFVKFLGKFLEAAWLPAILIYITVLVFVKSDVFMGWKSQLDPDFIRNAEDTSVMEFMKIFLGVEYQQKIVNSFTIILQNIIVMAYFCVLMASILGYLRWGIQNKQLYSSQKQQKQCIICESKDPQHIKYKHNVVKWIDFQINLKSRCQSSLSQFQKYIKGKIQKRELSLFYHLKKGKEEGR